MTGAPTTRFARTAEGAYIAYQVSGNGPIDLLLSFGFALPCDMHFDEPHLARALERLGTFCRVIRFDRRGTGASDPMTSFGDSTLERWVEDALAVLDDLGSSEAVLFGQSSTTSAPMMLAAATHPRRTRALILNNAFACGMRSDDHPWGLAPDELEEAVERFVQFHLVDPDPEVYFPSVAADPGFLAWFRKARHLGASPTVMGQLVRVLYDVDLRNVLPAIQAPTLILNRIPWPASPDLGFRRTDHADKDARYLAAHIPGARHVEFPGRDVLFWLDQADATLAAIEEFLTGRPPTVATERVLATIVFTDIVGSTSRAAGMGDAAWKELLGRFHRATARVIETHRGREVNRRGDDVLATFDGPARAVRYAIALRETAGGLGIEVRSGLHTGEVELMGDDVAGIAVHIGARVAELAGPGEILVSRTVVDLVAGSGLEFEDCGDHELKGVPRPWQLFRVLP